MYSLPIRLNQIPASVTFCHVAAFVWPRIYSPANISLSWHLTWEATLQQPLQNHPSRQLGGWAVLWSVDKMLEGQRQRVDIFANARTAHGGLLQKRLEEDLCWIIPHLPPTTQLVKRLNWSESFLWCVFGSVLSDISEFGNVSLCSTWNTGLSCWWLPSDSQRLWVQFTFQSRSILHATIYFHEKCWSPSPAGKILCLWLAETWLL